MTDDAWRVDAHELRRLMDAHGDSLRALAKRAQCSHQTIYHLLRGERHCKQETASRVAAALGVSLLDLFFDPTCVSSVDSRRRMARRERAASYRSGRERLDAA